MPVTIKVDQIKYKNSQGQYVGINGVSERETSEQITEIEHQGAQTRASIPVDYTALSDQVEALKEQNTVVIAPTSTFEQTEQGVTVTYSGKNTYHVSGTVGSGQTFYNAYDVRDNPLERLGLKVGDVVYVYSKSTNVKVRAQLWKKNSLGNLTILTTVVNDLAAYKIESDCVGLHYRIQIPANTGAVNDDIQLGIITIPQEEMFYIPTNPKHTIPSGTDLNDLTTNGIFTLTSDRTYVNAPTEGVPIGSAIAGYLEVFRSCGLLSQTLYGYGALPNIWHRDCNLNLPDSQWTPWRLVSDGSRGVRSTTRALGDNPEDPVSGSQIDFNDVIQVNRVYLVSDSHTYVNNPVAGSGIGFLHCFYSGLWNLQIMYPFRGNTVYKRRGNDDGSVWEDWQEISHDTYNITNEYSFPEYSQSVTLNASPQITADTNNYLSSTGDTTDRTSAILAMLTANGICRLGPGKYYISNLQMPDGSSIIGSGYSTEVHMIGSSNGFAIKMGSNCSLDGLCIIGSDSTPTFGETIGGRHGVLWQGDYTEHTTAPLRSMISNLWIYNFTGGGITCYDTGYGTSNALEATNVYIWSCWAGINISYWSEFHKFTNVRCGQCRIGCVNNGGNNIFVNCDFSSNQEIAMLMDNSQGQSPNHTHGSCIGCVFNHTQHNGQSNSGTGIEMLNCGGSGFIFTGCQIFFSKINLVSCDGIVFSNCNFGNSNCDITVDGGGAILFSGNMHQAKPPITITGNQNVHFTNCYVKTTGAIVEP